MANKKSKVEYIVIEHRYDVFSGVHYDAHNSKKYKQRKRATDYAKSLPYNTKIIKVPIGTAINININF